MSRDLSLAARETRMPYGQGMTPRRPVFRRHVSRIPRQRLKQPIGCSDGAGDWGTSQCTPLVGERPIQRLTGIKAA